MLYWAQLPGVLGKHCGKGKIAQKEQFHLFPQCFLGNVYLKSFNRHISIVLCSFFEFGTVSKWCIREWVKIRCTVTASVKLFGTLKSFD